MKSAEYISIPEFAKLAHKSPQAIYKQLNNRLNPYIKLVDNQKMLNINALSDFFGIEVEQPIKPELSTHDNQLIKLLEENQDLLRQQLKEKDKQIDELTAIIREQAESINADRKKELAGTLIESQQQLLSESPQQEPTAPKKLGSLFRWFQKK